MLNMEDSVCYLVTEITFFFAGKGKWKGEAGFGQVHFINYFKNLEFHGQQNLIVYVNKRF